MNEIQAYNYDSFVPEEKERWLRFDESPPLGRPAPDFSLTALDGEVARLSGIWRRADYTIVEFGSLT